LSSSKSAAKETEETTIPLIDTHAHLDFSRFDADREAVITRAREAGLVAIINAGTSLASSRASVALAEKHDFIYATVGVHPNNAGSHKTPMVTREVLDELRELASHPKVVAIGEIGLDYYRDHSPHRVQRRAFARQLGLAAELGLPTVVHCRNAKGRHRALTDVLTALKKWPWPGVGVIHSYSAGPKYLTEIVELGFSIGLSGPVTFPKAKDLHAVAQTVALRSLLVETDCPYLCPVPYRGKRNEPAFVQHVVEAIAGARDIPKEQVAEATTRNALRLFGINV
jgi:TatD DNase family protein